MLAVNLRHFSILPSKAGEGNTVTPWFIVQSGGMSGITTNHRQDKAFPSLRARKKQARAWVRTCTNTATSAEKSGSHCMSFSPPPHLSCR
jgi:hypothetical protein